ncbi:MAG: hypothetical protein ABSE22_20110 [Xanthobacteraceae bacterium]
MHASRRIGLRSSASRTNSFNNLAYVACVVLSFSWLLIHFRYEIPAFTFDLSSAFAHQDSASPQEANTGLQTGSILLLPFSGNTCRQRLIDNATWRIRDNGLVDCAAATAQNTESWRQRTTAIRNAFLHD